MVRARLVISIGTALLVTLGMVFSPVAYAQSCRCGGCCVGCPGDCTTIGAPLPYAYWGVNAISGEGIHVVSWGGVFVNLMVWLAVLLGLFRFARS